MRNIPSALQTKLDSGVTTLCHCWVLTRRDGVVQGYTDHDEDVTLNDVLCRAQTGFTAAEATARLGLAVDGTEISGALSDDAISEAALAAGRYDAAKVDVYLVDWSEPSLYVMLSRNTLGEVRREGRAFVAELRGLADILAQESGRLFTAHCTADLGDSRCKIDLTDDQFRGSGAVLSLTGASIVVVSGLDAFASGWFTAGRLTFSSGANATLAVEVKRHFVRDDAVIIELWQAMPEPIAPGDTFIVTAGCDKQFTTCRTKFNNVVNFRGFPHIPGNDFIVRYAIDGEPGHDGKSLRTEA